MESIDKQIMESTRSDNTIASIAAYFLAKFNEKALRALGYKTTTQAFIEISKLTGSKINYIKQRRDEFDPLIPDSPRLGWHKRDPAAAVLKYHLDLEKLSFEALLFKVRSLLDFQKIGTQIFEPEVHAEIRKYDEIEIENIINFKDQSAGIKYVSRIIKQRILDNSIIDKLKVFYNYRCQICGERHYDTYSVNISEGHHLLPFIESFNNNASNIIILCPNHHRLMHAANPQLDFGQKIFTYPNGHVEQIQINDHL